MKKLNSQELIQKARDIKFYWDMVKGSLGLRENYPHDIVRSFILDLADALEKALKVVEAAQKLRIDGNGISLNSGALNDLWKALDEWERR